MVQELPPAFTVQEKTNNTRSRAARCCPLADSLTVTAICLQATYEAQRPASGQTSIWRSRWAGGEPSRALGAAHSVSSALLVTAQKLGLPSGLCSPDSPSNQPEPPSPEHLQHEATTATTASQQSKLASHRHHGSKYIMSGNPTKRSESVYQFNKCFGFFSLGFF